MWADSQPALRNTRSTEEELTGTVRIQAFNGLKVKAKVLEFGLKGQGQVRGLTSLDYGVGGAS